MFLINRNKHQNDHHHHDRSIPSTQRFEWIQYNGSLPQNAVYASTKYVVIRGYYQNEWIPGKLNLSQKAAYVPYGNKEVHITTGIEILTMKPGNEVVWVPASHGQVVQDAVGPIGKEGTYVGRVVCPHPENIATPGKIHPGYKAFYLPWDGKEHKCDSYEVCVIRPQSYQPSPFVPTPSVGAAYNWVPYQGSVPQGAVTAGNNYVVIQAYHGKEWIPGKLNLAQRAAYIPYGGKEIHATNNIQVLTHAPGAEVHWIQASHGQVPQNAVGPIGKDKTFIGRAICPKPENAPTPGKIHPSHKCLYMPWDGKEHKSEAYEACVIQFPQHNTYPSMPSFPIPNQPGFGQHGFQQPGFMQPGFIQPGFMQPGFGQPGFGPGGHFGPGGNFGSHH